MPQRMSPRALELLKMQPSYLTRREASQYLTDNGYPFATSTLAKLFSLGGGPPARHFGRKPLYAPPDLLAWAEGRTSAPRQNSSQPRRPLVEAPGLE